MSEQQRSDAPGRSAIREQLERMLGRRPFASSPVLSRMLAHLVEHALTAGGRPLKEYAVGLEVFDRPDDFDPRLDTIVRVQARRLRQALADYYRNEGQHDAVRLDVPKGQYGIRASLARASAEASAESGEPATARGGMAAAAARPPVARTPLIGRADELRQVVSRLNDGGVRMLSITGVGGSGKTRLALAAADAVRAAYPGGVLFLDLTSVTQRDVLADLLAGVFNVRRTEGRPLPEAIAQRIRGKLGGRVLLVLDNMEGVLDGADILGTLLDADAQLNFLVTSRMPLRLYGEYEFPLPPLAVPSGEPRYDASELAAVPSVELFLARAAAANPRGDFAKDVEPLAELCVRLDGLPLAIELVAAQAGALSPRQMLERFTGHLDLPENPARDAPSRQRTLRRTIDSSYELLDDAARRMWRRLSVFAGGFTLEAAEAVADARGDVGEDLMPALTRLLAMGLLYFRSDGTEPRYFMLETLRAYGLERLSASGERDVVRKAHAAYCLVLAEEGVRTTEVDARNAWLVRLDAEQDNLRQALEYLLKYGPSRWCLRLGQALFAYWERRERLIECRRQLQRIVDTVPPEPETLLWAKVNAYLATVVAFQGDHAGGRERFEELLELYRRTGDQKGETMVLGALALTSRFLGDEPGARGYFQQVLESCRRLGDTSQIAASLSNLAASELRLGNTRAAHGLLNEARDLFVAQRDPSAAAWCLNHLGDVARAEGDYHKAAERYAGAEAEFRQLGDGWGLARTQADRGRLALDTGRPQQARPLLLQALAGFEALDHRRGMASVATSLARYALKAEQPALSVRLLAAAAAWRTALGFAARPDEHNAVAQSVLRQALQQIEETAAQALLRAGSKMTPAEIAAAIEALAGPAEE